MSVLASCSDTIRLWDTSGVRLGPLRTLDLPEAKPTGGCCWNQTGQVLVAAGDNGSVSVFKLSGEVVRTGMNSPHQSAIHGIAFSARSRKVAAGGEAGLVEIWDLKRGARRTSMNGHLGRVRCVEFFDNEGSVASADESGRILLHKLETPPELPPVPVCLPPSEEHYAPVTCLAVSRGVPTWIAASHADGCVRIWDTTRKACIRDVKGQHRRAVTGIAIHPHQHNLMCTVGDDGFMCCVDMRIWGRDGTSGTAATSDGGREAVEGGGVVTLANIGTSLTCLSICHEGYKVAIGSHDGNIRLVDLRVGGETGRPVPAFEGTTPPAGGVRHLAFQHRGSRRSGGTGSRISNSRNNTSTTAAASVESAAAGDGGGEAAAPGVVRVPSSSSLSSSSSTAVPSARNTTRISERRNAQRPARTSTSANGQRRSATAERNGPVIPPVRRLNTRISVGTIASEGRRNSIAEGSDTVDDGRDGVVAVSADDVEEPLDHADARRVSSGSANEDPIRRARADYSVPSSRAGPVPAPTRGISGRASTGLLDQRQHGHEHGSPRRRRRTSHGMGEWNTDRESLEEPPASPSSSESEGAQEVLGLGDAYSSNHGFEEHRRVDRDRNHDHPNYQEREAQEEAHDLEGGGKGTNHSNGKSPGSKATRSRGYTPKSPKPRTSGSPSRRLSGGSPERDLGGDAEWDNGRHEAMVGVHGGMGHINGDRHRPQEDRMPGECQGHPEEDDTRSITPRRRGAGTGDGISGERSADGSRHPNPSNNGADHDVLRYHDEPNRRAPVRSKRAASSAAFSRIDRGIEGLQTPGRANSSRETGKGLEGGVINGGGVVDAASVDGGGATDTLVQGMMRDKAVVEQVSERMAELKGEIQKELRNLHLDMLRQFHSLQEEYTMALSGFEERLGGLIAENQALRGENDRLRRVY